MPEIVIFWNVEDIIGWVIFLIVMFLLFLTVVAKNWKDPLFWCLFFIVSVIFSTIVYSVYGLSAAL